MDQQMATSETGRAEELLKAAQPARALAIAESVIAERPTMLRARVLAATALSRLGRQRDALGQLDACVTYIERTPDPFMTRLRLARAYVALDADAKAEKLARDAASFSPDRPEPRLLLAGILARLGREPEALQVYRELVRLLPSNPSVWEAMGVMAQRSGAPQEAVPAYRRALALDPDLPDVRNNLIAALIELKRPAEAIVVADDWLDRSPANTEALSFRCLLPIEAGRAEESAVLTDFDRMVQMHTIECPKRFASLQAFNRALEAHVLAHPELKTPDVGDPTYHHPALRITGQLLEGDKGPVADLEVLMRQAVDEFYRRAGEDKSHPFLAHRSPEYELFAWAAVLEGEGNQQPHIHRDGALSGCYYVTIPPEVSAEENGSNGTPPVGAFEVGRPPDELKLSADFPRRYIKPYEGLMVMFPAYLYHGTVPFRSTKRRICIAFDVVPRGMTH